MMSYAQWGNALYTGEKSYGIIQARRKFLAVGGAFMVISALLIGIFGLNQSIEFTGGSQFNLAGISDTSQQKAYDALASEGLKSNIRVSTVGVDGVRVQTDALDSEKTNAVREALATAYGVDVKDVQSSSIGPSWGKDVTRKALQSLVIFMGLVAVLMAAYFRSWTMSVAAMTALLHDVVVTVAFFALVRVEVSPATVIGFLTILGYSLYDTVVVFDKVRELTVDYREQKVRTYAESINLAVNQTMVRSINTSIVALLPVGAILIIGSFLLGAGTLTDISLALFVGMIAGTFSSIFIASPLLVELENWRGKNIDHDKLILAHRARKGGRKENDIPGVTVTAVPITAAGVPTVGAENVTPGQHLGKAHQPKRKKRNR